MRDQLLRGGAASGRFEGWFLRVKAPGLVAAQRSADLAWRQAAQPPGVAAVPPAVIDRELGALALALYALLGIAVIHAIEATVLSPRIVGKILHLHPVLVMVVLILGEHLAGLWGLLLAVPLSVYIIHAVVLGEAMPGVYEPPGAIHDRN